MTPLQYAVPETRLDFIKRIGDPFELLTEHNEPEIQPCGLSSFQTVQKRAWPLVIFPTVVPRHYGRAISDKYADAAPVRHPAP